jgi:hypothetical protein
MSNLPIIKKSEHLIKTVNTTVGLISQVLEEGDANLWYKKGLENKENEQWQATYYCFTKAIELDSSQPNYFFYKALSVTKLPDPEINEFVNLIITGFSHLSTPYDGMGLLRKELDDLWLFVGENIPMEGNANLFALAIIHYFLNNIDCIYFLNDITTNIDELGANYFILCGFVSSYESRIGIDKDFVDIYENSSNIYDLFRTSAIEYYTKAITIKPDLALAYYCRGIEKTKLLNNESDSIQCQDTDLIDYINAARLQPQYLERYFKILGTENKSYFNSDKFKAVKKGDKNILTDQVIGHYMRSYVLFQCLDYLGVIKDCEELIRLMPNDTYAYFQMGKAKVRLKDAHGAYKALTTGIDLYPNKDEIKAIITYRDEHLLVTKN